MRIPSFRTELREGAAPARKADAAPAAPTAGPAVAAAQADSVLAGARAVLDATPDVDLARVARLREALARGDIPFDAGRLAVLVDRYHGGRG